MNSSRIHYEGKIVYIGIDVHKKTYIMTAYCEGMIMKRATCPADPVVFADSLRKWFKGAQIKSVYEAGFSGFVLHRVLVAAGIENIVVNPSSVEVASKDRVKTDKRDSKKLAEQLSVGRLVGIYVPTNKEELKRQLPRTRDQLVKTRTRVANQIKGKLFQFGLMLPDDDRLVSNRFLKVIERFELPSELKLALTVLIETWRELTMKIWKLTRALKKQAVEDSALERVYRSVPGVGVVGSRILATELGDMSRFRNVRSLYSYTGLTPSEFSSGEHVRRGHISRQGNSWVRGVLVEIAWRTIAKDRDLREVYEKLKGRRGAKIAIVAIARKLIGRIRACLRSGEMYCYASVA